MSEKARVGRNVHVACEAVIEDDVIIGNHVKIGRHTIVMSGSIVEEACQIGANCVIGHLTKLEVQKKDFSAASPRVQDLLVKNPNTRIGADSIIRSGCTIYKNVFMGKKARLGHGALIREHTTIGDEVVVGSYAQIDGYVSIGNKSMIQSQCYIAQSTRIGKGVFIAPGCVLLDNKRIILGDGLNGATVKDYVRIGGGAKILPRIVIGKHALIGAGAIVTRNIPEKAICYGNPAKIIRYQSDEEVQTYIRSLQGWE